jgi:hypothetical protein
MSRNSVHRQNVTSIARPPRICLILLQKRERATPAGTNRPPGAPAGGERTREEGREGAKKIDRITGLARRIRNRRKDNRRSFHSVCRKKARQTPLRITTSLCELLTYQARSE